MKTPPPLGPETEAWLAPHRTVLQLAPSVEARAIARAAAAAELLDRGAVRSAGPGRPLWAFAAAAGVVVALGAGAYAARAWLVPSVPPTPGPMAPIASPIARAPRPPAVGTAVAEGAPPIAAVVAPEVASRSRIVNRPRQAMVVRPTNAELQLLRAARQEVTGGDFEAGLAVIAEHARRYRNGALVEEREALRIRALVALGREEEAQHATTDFRARFPHSVFLSTFDQLKALR